MIVRRICSANTEYSQLNGDIFDRELDSVCKPVDKEFAHRCALAALDQYW